MKLPTARIAVIDRVKVGGYLLNPEHPQGASKARFFLASGFHADDWELLALALKQVGSEDEVVNVTDSGFGPRYVIDGQLPTPVGRLAYVRTIWQIDNGQTAPRLITAYPLEVEE